MSLSVIFCVSLPNLTVEASKSYYDVLSAIKFFRCIRPRQVRITYPKSLQTLPKDSLRRFWERPFDSPQRFFISGRALSKAFQKCSGLRYFQDVQRYLLEIHHVGCEDFGRLNIAPFHGFF